MGVAGRFRATVETPMGVRTMNLVINENDGVWSGTLEGESYDVEMKDLKVDGDSFTFSAMVTAPTVGTVATDWDCTVYEDSLTGRINTSYMPLEVKGQRI